MYSKTDRRYDTLGATRHVLMTGVREDVPSPVLIGDLVLCEHLVDALCDGLQMSDFDSEYFRSIVRSMALDWRTGVRVERTSMDNSKLFHMLRDMEQTVGHDLLEHIDSFLKNDRLVVLRVLNSGLKPDDQVPYGRLSYYNRYKKTTDEHMTTRMPSFRTFCLNEAKGKGKSRASKQDYMKRDISSSNSIANAVWPIIEDLNKSLDKRKGDPKFFTDIRQRLLTAVNDEKVSASLETRRKWTDVINNSRSLVDLSMAMYNMWLKASGLGVDRGKM